jgi:hypothetical protein
LAPAIGTMHAPLTDSVRRLVAETLVALGLSSGAEPRETILIRDGAYCGRRFDSADGHAVWFIEEAEIKFFRCDGSLVRVIEPPGVEQSPGRKAA